MNASHFELLIRAGRRVPMGGVALAFWLAAVGLGWWAMTAYSFATSDPREQDAPRAAWPAGTSLRRAADRPTLLVFLHPKCPCSRATLSELERLLLRVRREGVSQPAVTFVFTVPSGADATWRDASLVRRCRRLPAAYVYYDEEGRETSRFGARHSGAVSLFDVRGQCHFRGGLTVARGHEGASAGAESLHRILTGAPASLATYPVFGCRMIGVENCSKLRSVTAPLHPAKAAADGPIRRSDTLARRPHNDVAEPLSPGT